MLLEYLMFWVVLPLHVSVINSGLVDIAQIYQNGPTWKNDPTGWDTTGNHWNLSHQQYHSIQSRTVCF